MLALFGIPKEEKDFVGKYKLDHIYAEKDGNPVEIFPVWEDYYLYNMRIDLSYLQDIITQSRTRIKGNFYVVVPENCTRVSDIKLPNGSGGEVHFRFLKFPYSILEQASRNFAIEEQPDTPGNIKNLVSSVGFYFNDEVTVKATRTAKGLAISQFTTRVFESKLFRFSDSVVAEDRLPDAEDIRVVVRSAMDTAKIEGDRISEENAQAIDLYFGQFMPSGRKKPKRESIPGNLTPVKTEDMDRSSIRISEIDKDVTVFLSEDYESEVGADNLFALEYLKGLRGKFKPEQLEMFEALDEFMKQNKDRIRALYGYKPPYVVNTSIFKTPQNMVRVTSTPEKLFVYGLIEHARYLRAWLKARDMGFYSIDYEYFRKGKDRVRASFNPDFFIKLNLNKYIRTLKDEGTDVRRLRELQDEGLDTIIKVVEIKSDDETDETTPAKERYADEHFAVLN